MAPIFILEEISTRKASKKLSANNTILSSSFLLASYLAYSPTLKTGDVSLRNVRLPWNYKTLCPQNVAFIVSAVRTSNPT
jgi:hypothetical protein